MFNPRSYQREYYLAHKKAVLAQAKEYNARPEIQERGLKYREERRDKYAAYSRRRRRLIAAGLWTFRAPANDRATRKETQLASLQAGWLAYFKAKSEKQTDNLASGVKRISKRIPIIPGNHS